MQLSLFPPETSWDSLGLDRQRFLDAMLAPQSRVGYRYDWCVFQKFCREHHRLELPASPDTVSLFLADQLRTCKVSTARRRYHAIARYHKEHGLGGWGRLDALLLLQGAQRLRAERPRRMLPVTISQVKEIAELLAGSQSVAAIRDRALMLLGFTSALRGASLAAITLDDLEFCSEGLLVTIPREKQDQEARGRLIGIPHGKHETTCTVKAVRAWLDTRADAPTRWMFLGRNKANRQIPMSPKTVREIVKRSVELIGLNRRQYGAHSLRSGFITAAGEAGLSDLLIAEQTGHRDMDCLRRYLRRTNVFRANACVALDL